MTTKHPAPPGAQRRAFEAIAAGDTSPMMAPQTRDALLRKGLIEEVSPKVPAFWPGCRINQFEVPIPLHIKFCAWCAEQP